MSQTYDQIYQRFFNAPPPEHVKYGESKTDILREARGFIEGFDLTMQTQVGCPGGCLFCYVPSGRMLTPESLRGGQWGFEVRPKREVVKKFETHLREGQLADKTIYWSGVTDPYATRPAETRAIWDALNNAPAHLRPRRIAIQTRYRPDRDAETISDYVRATASSDGGPAVVVSYSIGSDREDLIRAWEKATPSYQQRMTAIQTLRESGIWVVPTLSPFGLWSDLEGTLRQFKGWQIPYITCLFFKKATDSANTPSPFLAYLEHEYPMLLDPQWQHEQLARLQSVYGDHVLLSKAGFASLTAPHRALEKMLS
ncbi:MAG: radical SAM protein [Chloroflexi bacterium]|nr:radical SAM protein [Chloroflexota bacterium]MCC6892187.1 radical SAM protein [Anaerolineae bacterium]